VVRVRPLNSREIARNANVIVKMEGNQTILTPPEGSGTTRTPEKPRVFSYDHSYWSFDKKDSHFGMSLQSDGLMKKQLSNVCMTILARIYLITRFRGIILVYLPTDKLGRESLIR